VPHMIRFCRYRSRKSVSPLTLGKESHNFEKRGHQNKMGEEKKLSREDKAYAKDEKLQTTKELSKNHYPSTGVGFKEFSGKKV